MTEPTAQQLADRIASNFAKMANSGWSTTLTLIQADGTKLKFTFPEWVYYLLRELREESE